MGETRSYNEDNTLATISYSGAAIGDLSYNWDANKNKTSESIGGVMSGYGFSAGYNAEDRLISWDRSDTNLDQSWDLSPVGDWNSITENLSVQNRTHGPVHEILTAASQAVQHDPKGNMTLIPPALRPGSDPLKLKWDFDNKLHAADTDNDGVDDVFYRWDALGRRVGRDDGTTNVVYFHDGQQTLADYPAGAASGSPSYTYVYASYIDEVVRRSGGGAYAIRYYHRNAQYSVVALTSANGSIIEHCAYTAYGQVTFTSSSGTTVMPGSKSDNRFTYTGREWDTGLGLYHYRARMYDPIGGRFVSRDPIGFDGSQWSLWEYVNGSPVSGLDPLGLAWLGVSGTGTIGGVVGTSAWVVLDDLFGESSNFSNKGEECTECKDGSLSHPKLFDSAGNCCADVQLRCRRLNHRVGGALGGMHCFLLAFNKSTGAEILTVSGGPDENGSLVYQPNADWRQGGFQQPFRMPSGASPCEFLRCAHNAAKNLNADTYEYTSLFTNSNWFISEITYRCGGSAEFPSGAYGGSNVGIWR